VRVRDGPGLSHPFYQGLVEDPFYHGLVEEAVFYRAPCDGADKPACMWVYALKRLVLARKCRRVCWYMGSRCRRVCVFKAEHAGVGALVFEALLNHGKAYAIKKALESTSFFRRYHHRGPCGGTGKPATQIRADGR
jgi:hypothetical protein